MHKWISKGLFLIALVISTSTFAVGAGFYLGGMFGPSTNQADNQLVQTPNVPPFGSGLTLAKPKSSQWASRLFMGYQINDYVGFEGGVTFFSKIKYDTLDLPTCTGPSVRVRTLDLVGRAGFAFYGFQLFGKGGLAVVYQAISGSLNPDFTRSCGRSLNQLGYKPTFSVGAGYDLSPSWVVDLTWTRTMMSGYAGNVDWYGLGISYHFVNRYCGQFLCDD